MASGRLCLEKPPSLERPPSLESAPSDGLEGPSSDVCAAPSCTVEPVAVVNSRCLARATRPPVTIRNFFTPLAARSSSGNSAADGSLTAAAKPNVTNGKSTVKPIRDFFAAKVVALADTAHEGDMTSPRDKDKDQPSAGGLKRGLCGLGGRAGKRAKTIKRPLSLGNKKSMSAGRQCPICDKQFAATEMNTDINKHIDNCLIE